jgi:hypothetical protein
MIEKLLHFWVHAYSAPEKGVLSVLSILDAPVRPLVWLQEGYLLHILFGHQAERLVMQQKGSKNGIPTN